MRTDVLSDRYQEFPRHDERLVGRHHRYGYATEARSNPDGGIAFGSLLKVDVDRAETTVHDVGAGRAAMEPVFVPRDAGADEDDGWVLACVHDARRDACDVVVLDAQDFTAPPLATVHLPVRVPFGFHGNWIADAP